jgi:hypothetical protein
MGIQIFVYNLILLIVYLWPEGIVKIFIQI